MAIAAMSSEFSSMLSHYKLREEDCEKLVTHKHLGMISLKCCQKWKLLASQLELENNVVDDIDHKTCNEEEKRHDFLKEWRQRKGREATYKKLILALLEYDQRQDAEKVCKILRESIQASAPEDITGEGTHAYI